MALLKRSAVLISLVSVLGSSSVLACGAPTDDPSGDAPASASQLIIGGTAVTTDTIGTPSLWNEWNGGGLCSATLLSDGWLLTAQHCVTQEGVPTGGTKVDPSYLHVNLLNGTQVRGSFVWTIYLHPTRDIALVNYAYTASLRNSADRPWSTPLYLGNSSDFVGKTVLCQGWGRDSCTGGGGVLRSASIPVTSAYEGTISARTESGQYASNNIKGIKFSGTSALPWTGDSGSSCFAFVEGQWNVISVDSMGTQQEDKNGNCIAAVDSYQNGVETFRDWAEGIMGNAVTVFADADFGGATQQLLPGGPSPYYDLPRLTVGNDAISSLVVPNNWALYLYQDMGFSAGSWFYSAGQYATLDGGADNQASSANVLYGGVVAFDRKFLSTGGNPYTGGLMWSPGDHALQYPYDNWLSSLTIPAGWRVTLFDNNNYSGASITLSEGTYGTLGDFDNRASSVRVLEPVVAYRDPSYQNQVTRYAPGCHDMNQLGQSNDSISSVFVPYRRAVQLFWNMGLSGPNVIYGSGQSQSGLGSLNDQVSSLCVYSMPNFWSGRMNASDAISNVGSTFQNRLISSDTRFELNMQTNGSLVLTQGSTTLWSTPGTGQLATMQDDGNFVVYNSNHSAVWASNTSGNPGAYLALQDDGNLVIYSSTGSALWASNTCCR